MPQRAGVAEVKSTVRTVAACAVAANSPRLVRPYLDEASDALGETIGLARLDGSDVVYLATRESHDYLRTISRVGRRVPA